MTTATPESVAQLAQRVGRTRMTVWNWITKGVTVAGRNVRLAAYRAGGRWCIDPEMYEQFVKDCNPEQPVLPESPAAEARRLKADQERARRLIG